MKLGIDIGASAMKFAAVRDGRLVFKRYIPGRPDVMQAMLESGIIPQKLQAIALTGVGAEAVDEGSLIAPCRKVPELDAIAAGGRLLAGRDSAIVASIGTGTAFVAAKGEECRHLCGTGVGGGTLRGFAALLGYSGAEELMKAAMDGDISKVDLSVGELFSGSETLDPRLTAANLAKALPDADKADWAAGMTNLVLQTVGTMSLLAAQAAGIKCVIVTGATATGECSQINFHNFQKIYNVEFIIPPHAECATAFGAATLI